MMMVLTHNSNIVNEYTRAIYIDSLIYFGEGAVFLEC